MHEKNADPLHKNSSMNENIESVKKYNLWFGNTIDCGFPRPLYTESVASYLGSKVVKVNPDGTKTCGKKLYIASNCHASCATGGQQQ